MGSIHLKLYNKVFCVLLYYLHSNQKIIYLQIINTEKNIILKVKNFVKSFYI